MYMVSGDTSLFAIGEILHICEEFTAKIAMIPFGIGAVIFYYYVMKAGVFPKWLDGGAC